MDEPSKTPRHARDPHVAQWRGDRAEIDPAPSLPKKAIYRDYAAAPEAVFNDLLETVTRLGHKIYDNNPEAGRLGFLTRPSLISSQGQDMTATVTPYNDRTRLEFKARRRKSIPATEWGEHEKRAREVLRAIDPTKPVLAQNLTNPKRKLYNLLAGLAIFVILGAIVGLWLLTY